MQNVADFTNWWIKHTKGDRKRKVTEEDVTAYFKVRQFEKNNVGDERGIHPTRDWG